MLKSSIGFIFLLSSLIWISNAIADPQINPNASLEAPGIEKGAYDIPLGVKLADFLKWCVSNNVKVTNEKFLEKKEAVENEIKKELVEQLGREYGPDFVETNTKSIQRQTKKILKYKLDDLKELLINIQDGKKIPFEFGEKVTKYDVDKLLAEIEYVQGQLFLFQYQGEGYILNAFFNNKQEITDVILDKIKSSENRRFRHSSEPRIQGRGPRNGIGSPSGNAPCS